MRAVKPMLATSGSTDDLTRDNYIFEPKLDGFRALCAISTAVRFTSRTLRDLTDDYPEFDIREYINAKTAIIDGEIIMYDAHGNPSFSALQRRGLGTEKHLRHKHATFVVFDILMKNDVWLTNMPLRERKKILAKTVRTKKGLIERVIDTDNGPSLWKAAQKHKLEGVIAKQRDSLYYPGTRTREWIKIKTLQTVDCIIIGFTQEKRHISALALGLYDNEKLIYIGKVGTGFSESTIATLYAKLKKIVRATAPCATPIGNAIWVRPTTVCEIEFLQWTKDLKLRSPVFLRVRTDKKARDCSFEQ